MNKGHIELNQEIPNQVVASLQTTLQDCLIAVVLFGSQARGEESDESDWDLLVIAKELPEKTFERHLFLKRMLPPNCRGAASILAKTPEEFESHLPSLYLDIALDGKILYDPCGYLANKLAILQDMIKRSGLYRERTKAGDVWRWQKESSGSWELKWEK